VKPPSALVTKGVEVEEWVDLHFFRPLGARIADALYPTRVSPDLVTLWSLLLGLAAGHLFLYSRASLNALGFALFVVSDIFDSADGQLARLRGTSTRAGRILDGLSDNARFTNLYLHLLARLIIAGWAWPSAVVLVAAGGFSHSLQSSAVDFIRHAFLYIGVGRGSELELPEDVSVTGTALQRAETRLFRAYVRRQARMFPTTVALLRTIRQQGTTPALRANYREQQAPLIPACAWLGQNIRFVLVGLPCVLGRPDVFLWITAIPLNAVMIWLVLSHERRSARVLEDLETEAHVHDMAG
jgi:phosphatidylglycerophosphate synthase